MGYRGGGCENVWLAWDGEDQAVLGYFASKGEDLVKHRKGAIVLCHLKPHAFREGNRSGIVVDVFSIGPGESFLRTLRLPRGTHSVELLIDDAQTARPLKAFELARETDIPAVRAATGAPLTVPDGEIPRF